MSRLLPSIEPSSRARRQCDGAVFRFDPIKLSSGADADERVVQEWPECVGQSVLAESVLAEALANEQQTLCLLEEELMTLEERFDREQDFVRRFFCSSSTAVVPCKKIEDDVVHIGPTQLQV